MGQADDPGRGRHSALPDPPALPDGADPTGPAAASSPEPARPPVPGRHRARGSLTRLRAAGRWPLVALGAVAIALLVVAVTTATSGQDPGTAPTTATAATTSGDDLVAWASTQLPVGATLTADPALATELERSGAEPGTVITGDAPVGAAEGPQLEVVRGDDTGGRTVVARFRDATGEELTVVDPAAVLPDVAELEQRRRLGEALLANPMTAPPEGVAQRLSQGEVDPRLLVLLAGMAARFGIQLGDLPAVAGEEAGAPARAAVVVAVRGEPVAEGSAGLVELRSYLDAQLDVFSPDEVRLVEGGLLVRFRYLTDPDGAVTPGGG